MDASRWKQIDDLLDAALDLAPEKRLTFLDQVCAGDEALRKEIEELLSSDHRAGNFILAPILQAASEPSAEEKIGPDTLLSLLSDRSIRPGLTTGAVVSGRYEILSRLGKGGMGEVWHAYDRKLRVEVALKTIHLDPAGNHDVIELLRHEVRSAREVISPNVCRIFDLVAEDVQELISMEYVDGITLLAMLKEKGSMKLHEASDIAAQFLAGIEAIHHAGLVHCDLKPENIMITRAGRVVVMDFGIAKQATQSVATVSGTLPYMSPEQMSGNALDARSDVFSAGVVLAEMIHPEGIGSHGTREEIWNAVHQNPLLLAESPWKTVIVRAVAANREDRFPSAGSLARALEEATQRVEKIEEHNPYPGLASFATNAAEYFVGRELEVENVIKKLQQHYLMALVGPSGAGKTSFLRAGLIPALPPQWSCVFCVPGDSPVLNLEQAVLGQFPSDKEPGQTLALLSHWRNQCAEAVWIVDRFEEVFTLNNREVQSRFVELITRASMDLNVRVLLSLRDDFLLRCHDFPALAPVFSELTPLGALSGPALRRALVQPALKCAYRYEDESLVDEILSDVEKERGALPLMAFAAARLWDKRDRKSGTLTRKAYQEIGGVEGALAKHAEQTMDRIGGHRQPIVREIFRNLITTEGTRVARDTEDVLSVFPERSSADEVLQALIDARLLTSFEAPPVGAEKSARRVEIIHESLLSRWPRMVRWQTQDMDSAQMRDQLRQAAQMWEQRSRSEDLLWTGAAFLEYQAWRQRYSGRLTAPEEAFASAMAQRAGKKRRQRRLTVAAAFLVLLVLLIAISMFWRNASLARDEAIVETHRAEAGRVLAVARSLTDADPSTKLAYALRSLELADTREARQFALQALSEGPVYRAIGSLQNPFGIQFSPDGQWIAAAMPGGAVQLLRQDGSKPVTISRPDSPITESIPWYVQFSPDSELLLWTSRKDASVVKVWSMSKKEIIRTFHLEGLTICFVRGGKAFFITDNAGKTDPPFFWRDCVVRAWDFGSGQPETLGNIQLGGGLWKFFDVDPSGRSIAYAKDDGVYISDLSEDGVSSARLIGTHSAKAQLVRFNPNGTEIASSDANGEIRLWSLSPTSQKPLRIIAGNGQPLFNLWFDPRGTSMMAPRDGYVFRWDLTAPADAEPQSWRGEARFGTYDQRNHALALAGRSMIVQYDSSLPESYTFKGILPTQTSSSVRFLPDGKSFIIGFSDDGISIHGVPGENQPESKKLANPPQLWEGAVLDVDSSGHSVALPTSGEGLHLLSIADSRDIQLKGLSSSGIYGPVAFSPDGKTVAAVSVVGHRGIEVWDLHAGSSRILENSIGPEVIKYALDGTLFSGDTDGNLRRWNVTDNSVTTISKGVGKGRVTGLAISSDGHFVATSSTSNVNSELRLYDLRAGTSSVIQSHGNRVYSVAFDPKATQIVTGDYDGVVRVGPINGETPILLLGHDGVVGDVAVDPYGKWILSSALNNPTVRLWRMPDGNPLQALSAEEFENSIREKTNLRVIADERLPAGYRTQLAPFPGWGERATIQNTTKGRN